MQHGGFLPAVKQLANVAALPGIVKVSRAAAAAAAAAAVRPGTAAAPAVTAAGNDSGSSSGGSSSDGGVHLVVAVVAQTDDRHAEWARSKLADMRGKLPSRCGCLVASQDAVR
jgi:hypothetical protein